VVVVGAGLEARELAELIIDHPETRLELAGIVGNLGVAERSGLADIWIGPTGRLVELMHQHEVTGAIVTATGFRSEQFRSITKELFGSGYDVHVTTGVSRMWEGRFEVRSLAHEPLIVMGRNEPAAWQELAKRGVDLVGASVAILLAAPVMLLAALAIKLEDRGPIVYAAPRAGRRGEFFSMYKFRSMVVNADELKAKMAEQNERSGPLFKVSNDPRITRVGRFIRETSIDELPQLFNVIKGDMSLVGPRPALPEEQQAFDEELRERGRVRPGITGLWQVEARSNAAFNAYRRLDLHYVENWNIGLDLRILLATAEQVVVTFALLPLRLIRRRQGASIDGISGAGANDTNPDVIDLRDRTRARLAAEETAAGTATPRDRSPGPSPTAR
jgi:exopolysaccharide biosynthesis polyprenyl glycosylphosphotransferase